MRTKTLLIGAAALVASVISSQAQGTVYSQNVVGYINQTIPGGGKFAEYANQLVNGSDVNQSNNAVNTVLASGLVSDPNGPCSTGSNTVLYVFNGSSYNLYFYFNVADGGNYGVNGSTAGWYDQGGTAAPVSLIQGGSTYLQNAFTGPITVTQTGTVLQGTNQLITVPTGFSLLALGTPISTNIDAAGIIGWF